MSEEQHNPDCFRVSHQEVQGKFLKVSHPYEKPMCEFWRDFHHKVVDEGLMPLRPEMEGKLIADQAEAVVKLLKSVVEAKRLIASHCECSGRNVVWRFQKGKGYDWVECKECKSFWELVTQCEIPN